MNEINEKSKQKLKFTKNEKMWVTDILNYQARIHKLQESIKEQYNIDSSFDFETFTLHLKDSEINESYNLDLFNYKYRYVQGEGLSKKRDIFGRQHFEDYLFIEHDWFLNSTSLTNRLQYKTSKFIIEGGIGIDYNHIDKNLDLNIKTGIGYKLF